MYLSTATSHGLEFAPQRESTRISRGKHLTPVHISEMPKKARLYTEPTSVARDRFETLFERHPCRPRIRALVCLSNVGGSQVSYDWPTCLGVHRAGDLLFPYSFISLLLSHIFADIQCSLTILYFKAQRCTYRYTIPKERRRLNLVSGKKLTRTEYPGG